jgi:hypothetical protein
VHKPQWRRTAPIDMAPPADSRYKRTEWQQRAPAVKAPFRLITRI